MTDLTFTHIPLVLRVPTQNDAPSLRAMLPSNSMQDCVEVELKVACDTEMLKIVVLLSP